MNHLATRITQLQENEIFVFGSNLAGKHGIGTSKFAQEKFGAIPDIVEGITGQCYALPIMGVNMEHFSDERLTQSIYTLWNFAESHSSLFFLLSKIGCGLVGFDYDYMAYKFRGGPMNIIKPTDWESSTRSWHPFFEGVPSDFGDPIDWV